MGLKLLGLKCYVLCVLSSEHASRHEKGGCKKQCKGRFCCGNTSYQHFVLNYMCSSGMAIHCMSEEYIQVSCQVSLVLIYFWFFFSYQWWWNVKQVLTSIFRALFVLLNYFRKAQLEQSCVLMKYFWHWLANINVGRVT